MGDFTWGLVVGFLMGLVLFHTPTRNKIINYIKGRRQPAKTTKKKKADNEIR